MIDPQDLQDLVPHLIRDEVRGFRDDQFPRSGHAPRPADLWIVPKLFDALLDPGQDEVGGGGMVCGEREENFPKVFAGLRRQNDSH